MKLDARVKQLSGDIARGHVYPHSASFCLWLLDSDIYKKLNIEQITRLAEYLFENEHMGVDVPKEDWEHLLHAEWQKECFVCTLKDPAEDYKLYYQED